MVSQACTRDYAYDRGKIDRIWVTDKERAALPPVGQAMTLDHSARGKSLYIGAHCVAIEGMPYDSTRALIDGLTEFATQQRYVCRHHWRPHDMIIWDNRTSLFSIATEKCYMAQTTIAGDTPIVTDAV